MYYELVSLLLVNMRRDMNDTIRQNKSSNVASGKGKKIAMILIPIIGILLVIGLVINGHLASNRISRENVERDNYMRYGAPVTVVNDTFVF